MCLEWPDINLKPPWIIKIKYENSNRAWVVTICSYYWGLFCWICLKYVPVRNSDLQSSCLAAIFMVFKARWFWSLLCSNLRFWASFNLLSSQRLIKSFPKTGSPLPHINGWPVSQSCRQKMKIHFHMRAHDRSRSGPCLYKNSTFQLQQLKRIRVSFEQIGFHRS